MNDLYARLSLLRPRKVRSQPTSTSLNTRKEVMGFDKNNKDEDNYGYESVLNTRVKHGNLAHTSTNVGAVRVACNTIRNELIILFKLVTIDYKTYTTAVSKNTP